MGRRAVSKRIPAHRPRSAGQAEVEMGMRLRVRRVEMKLSQQELGTKLGVSFQQVQKYEKGVNRIGASRLEQIASALQVPVGFFFGGNGREREAEGLIFQNAPYNLRLLRAFAAIKDVRVQRKFVGLMERVAGIETPLQD